MRAEFSGQELFMFEGDLVFISHRDPEPKSNSVFIALYPEGETFRVDEAELEPATPEELEEWGI